MMQSSKHQWSIEKQGRGLRYTLGIFVGVRGRGVEGRQTTWINWLSHLRHYPTTPPPSSLTFSTYSPEKVMSSVPYSPYIPSPQIPYQASGFNSSSSTQHLNIYSHPQSHSLSPSASSDNLRHFRNDSSDQVVSWRQMNTRFIVVLLPRPEKGIIAVPWRS